MNWRYRILCLWIGGYVWINVLVPAHAATWNEQAFFSQKKLVAQSFVPPKSPADISAKTLIGAPTAYVVKKQDTLLDIARYFDLGYNEIVESHPDVDPWVPPDGNELSLPTFWILPKSSYEGVVVNIAEMRMYYYPTPGKKSDNHVVITLPVGLGREDRPTPQAKFKVTGKTPNPTWIIPDSIKQERIKEKGWSETSIPGGSPRNPLGKFRIDLSLPLVKIHGTNNPWAVGRLVTHGCIRMYPEDIKQFFDVIRIGCPGEFLYQPVKIGMLNGKVYAEIHRDIYNLVPDLWEEAKKVATDSGHMDIIDMSLLQKALVRKSGVPTDVTKRNSEERPGERLDYVRAAGDAKALSPSHLRF